jgi:hypothetical protein
MRFEMTAAEAERYGSGLSIWEKIALLNSFAPLIGFAQRFSQETDPFKRGLVVADACEWLASKTSSSVDDELVKHLAAVLRTPEGESLVRWCLLQVEALKRD